MGWQPEKQAAYLGDRISRLAEVTWTQYPAKIQSDRSNQPTQIQGPLNLSLYQPSYDKVPKQY